MEYLEILRQRYRLILRYTGIITMVIGGVMLLPLLCLWFFPGDVVYIKYFILAAVMAFSSGYALYTTMQSRPEISLTLKEGGIIVVISWGIAILISALPFVWGLQMSWTGAIFEVVSGWTTTGLSVMVEEETPGIFLLWRSLMQMLGGAGLAVIALSSILPMQGLGLYNAEGRTDQLLPHVRRSTKMIMQIYIGYIVAGVILYTVAGMDLFAAINHSMAAISTGGFSTVGASIGHWDSIMIEIITIVLMFLGTINFAIHYILLQGKFKVFFKNAEVKLMVIVLTILIPITAVFLFYSVYQIGGTAFRQSSFQLISALSTTGFSTIDFAGWPVFANLIIVLLMIIGGGTGSTAGGVKQFRVYIMFKSILNGIRDQFSPKNQVREDFIWRGGDRWYLRDNNIKEVYNYLGIYLFTFVVGVLIFLAYGYPLEESLFEFASALGTVGLSIGITSITAPAPILWTEIIAMILGRLEFFIIVFALIKLIRDFSYRIQRTI